MITTVRPQHMSKDVHFDHDEEGIFAKGDGLCVLYYHLLKAGCVPGTGRGWKMPAATIEEAVAVIEKANDSFTRLNRSF